MPDPEKPSGRSQRPGSRAWLRHWATSYAGRPSQEPNIVKTSPTSLCQTEQFLTSVFSLREASGLSLKAEGGGGAAAGGPGRPLAAAAGHSPAAVAELGGGLQRGELSVAVDLGRALLRSPGPAALPGAGRPVHASARHRLRGLGHCGGQQHPGSESMPRAPGTHPQAHDPAPVKALAVEATLGRPAQTRLQCTGSGLRISMLLFG